MIFVRSRKYRKICAEKIFLLAFSLTVLHRMNTDIVSTQKMNDQEDIETSMRTKATIIEATSDPKAHELAKQKIVHKV